MSVVLQCRINLGITETSVHLGAVDVVAVLGEHYTLYFVRLPLVLEMHFHILPFQVGDKHIPVATPADFSFEDS